MDRKRFLQICGMAIPAAVFGFPTGLNAAEKTGKAKAAKEKFSFAFFTDVHLNRGNEGNCDEGFRTALADVKKRGVDFILFGGDNVEANYYPGHDHEHEVVDMYTRFRKIVDESGIPCHFTIGNHDTFDRFEGKEAVTGYEYFEKFCGPVRRSFNHKGVHFITLNSLVPDKGGHFSIGEEQMQWLKSALDSAGRDTPSIISLHVPVLSLYYPVVEGDITASKAMTDMISDTRQVIDLIRNYNVKLVLQGHQHIHEEILERGQRFITGGAICSSWWYGPLADTQEGYVLVHVGTDNSLTWEYIDYGWEAIRK